MSGGMTAKRLRLTLIIAMFLIIAALAGGFVFAQKNLKGYASQISQLNADANSGDQSISTLKQIETRLDQEQGTMEAARSVIADNATFAEQVVSDVTRIAAQSGVTITSLEYVDSSATGTAGTPATTAPVAAVPTQPGVSAAPAGVTNKSISVTIESPLEYAKLMNFIRNIESNRLKLQIATVTMTKEQGGKVGTQTFSIGAYVR